MPKVSIILTSFNHEKYICEAIDSVLAQTFTDFELIIWDDASSDNSWRIITTYSDSRIKSFRNDECRRAIYGVNKTIREIASGEYIAFQHSDDVWEKDKLEKQVEFLDTHPEIGALFTNALAIGESSEPLNDAGHFYSNIFDQPNRTRHEWLNYFFYHGNALCHPSVLIRKHCYSDCGTYRYGFAQVGDFDMWIRICLKYEIHVLQEKLIRFRVRNNEANTSGSRPETRIRGVTEFYQVFANYLRLDSFEEFVAVFPGAKQFYRKNGFVPGFVLAMLSLEPNALHMAKTYGSISLFNLLWDDKTSGKIKELYNFDYRDLIELTGKHDIFSQEAVANLGKIVTEQNEQIVNLNQTVIEYNSRIARLQHQIEYQTAEIHASTSWRLTRPIRSIKSILITLSIHAKQGPLTGIMRFAGFNNLLRRVYRNLPLPLIVKQRLEQIYLRQFGASNQADIVNENTFQFEKNHEFLPLIAVSAKQFDPNDPWVLVVDLRTPTPDQDSGSVRMSAIIRLLREMEFRITFISDSEEYLPHYQETLEGQGIDVLRGFNAARRHLADAGGKYHFVLLSRPEVAFQYLPYVRAYALYATIIYDTVDLHWIRFEREMQVSGDRSLLDVIAHFRRMELFNTACADLVLAITNEERNRLLIEQPDAKITILPNIHEPYPPKMSFDQRKGLLFIGSFWHKPNEDAIIYFVRDILPKIIEEIPDLVFYIIGSNMPATVRALRSANVEPLGFVANVAPYFESCRIFVAPLRFGAGMKGKVGQSMSHGLPVITTQIGAEGMGLHHGKHVLVATGPQDFADSVVRLYGNKLLWRNLSTESLVYLKANYSLAANRKQMVEIFGRTQNKSRLTGHQEAGMAITTCQ